MHSISLPQIKGHDLLTHSRVSTFQTCPRRHYYRYSLGIAKDRPSDPLRIGSAVHLGLDLFAQGKTPAQVAERIQQEYAIYPAWATTEETQREWEYEAVTVVTLLMAYHRRWEGDGIQYIATEQAFRLPLINPETGGASTAKDRGGKIDKIVRLADGRMALMEHKTTSDSIEPQSDYWARLRVDHQISGYMQAARTLVYDVQTVLYDVIRKPTIEPTRVPLTDDDGIKIVLDAAGNRVKTKDGKKWRESSDTAAGYVLQTRPMTTDEWAEKLSSDIVDRPDFYFARQEIPRLDSDLEEYNADMWAAHQAILQCERLGHWPRNTQMCMHPYRCEYFEPCTSGHDFTSVPEGFRRVDDLHPELAV